MADDKLLRKQRQIKLLEDLQELLLEDFKLAFENNTITATDRSTLIRWLQANGLDLDSSRIPQVLKDKLTAKLPASEVDADEAEPRHLRAI